MKTSITSLVGWLLLFSALTFYCYGIGEAIQLSWNEKTNSYPELLSTTIGSIQALLLANLGAVLGISVAKPNSAIARQALPQINATTSDTKEFVPPLQLKEKIQLFALCLYILTLIGCLITWWHTRFSSDPKIIIPIVSQSGQMFIGVVLAYLSLIFS